MNERYRIGFDITVLWAVSDRNGAALPLTDKEVHLYYTNARGRHEADIRIQDGNVVVWDFFGKDQRTLGNYTLTLEIIQPYGRRTIKMDKCGAFALVGRSCEEGSFEGEANINNGGEITLASELDIYRIQPVVPVIGKNGNWWVEGVDTGKPARVDVVNAADEEDITSEDNLLKLKDRDDALGMGYVILRKNKTFVEQVTKENTIYEIRYDFDGASATCNIPSDAVLLFNGGRILNMTVIGNNTAIVAPQREILNNVTIGGTFNNSKVFSEWVGLTEGGADNFNKLVALMNLAKGDSYSEVFIQSGDYYTSCKGHYSAINIPSNTHVYNGAHIYALPSDLEKFSIFTMVDVENVIFEGGRIIGDLDTHNGTTGEWGYGIYLVGARHCIVRDVHISRCWGDGINAQALYSDYENKTITGHCYDITIERVVCDYNRRQGMSIEGAIGMVVRDSVFSNTGKINGTLPMAGIDVEPWYTEEVVRDLTFENCTFEGNQGHNFFISLTEAMFLTENCRDFFVRNCSFLEGELVTLNRTRGLIFDCNHVTCVFATNKNHDMLIQNNKFDNQVTIFSEGYAEGGKFMANTINSQLGNILEIPLIIGNSIYGGIRGQRQEPAALYKNNIIRGSDNEEFILVNTMATFEGNHITLSSPILIKNNSRVLFYNNVIDVPSGVTAITMQTAHQSAFPNDGEIIGNLFVNTLLAYRNWSGAGVYEVRSNTYAAAKTYGKTEQRPDGLDSSHIGFMFYDTTIWKPIWWAGTKWADAAGTVV